MDIDWSKAPEWADVWMQKDILEEGRQAVYCFARIQGGRMYSEPSAPIDMTEWKTIATRPQEESEVEEMPLWTHVGVESGDKYYIEYDHVNAQASALSENGDLVSTYTGGVGGELLRPIFASATDSHEVVRDINAMPDLIEGDKLTFDNGVLNFYDPESISSVCCSKPAIDRIVSIHRAGKLIWERKKPFTDEQIEAVREYDAWLVSAACREQTVDEWLDQRGQW